jgi:hypothetical protein
VEFPVETSDVRGNKYILEAPLFHPKHLPIHWNQRTGRQAIGHPCYADATTWKDIALDLADEFHRAMGRRFDLRGATARFLAAVIPLITGERPSAEEIGPRLMRLHSRREKHHLPPRRKRAR